MIEISHYREKRHKKTVIYADNLFELNKWLIKQLKTWKGTPATISVIEKQNNEIKQDIELVDPMLARIPAVKIKLNGFHKFEG